MHPLFTFTVPTRLPHALLLLLVWAWSAPAATANAVIAQCLSGCEATLSSCVIQERFDTICHDHNRVCVERCDPRRLDKNSVMSIYPPSAPTVSGPRHLLPRSQQVAICRQDCALSAASCQNSYQTNDGSAPVYGGRNDGDLCRRSQQRCNSQCEKDPSKQISNLQ